MLPQVTRIDRSPTFISDTRVRTLSTYECDESREINWGQKACDNESGFVDWFFTDITHGFHIFTEEEIAEDLSRKCKNDVTRSGVFSSPCAISNSL